MTGAGQQLAYALQLGLGVTFLLAAAPKLRDPSSFYATVVEYRIIGPRASKLVAASLIAVECFLALGFLTGAAIEPVLALALATLGVFAVATAVNLRRDRRVSCGCFGDPAETISPRSLARIGLLACGVIVLAAAFSSDGASVTTLAGLSAQGGAPEYVVETAGLAGALSLVAIWLLHFREFAYVLGRLLPERSR
jgi:lysylphosphatidylglycerol synthetase-like protein (DUF2156 family)